MASVISGSPVLLFTVLFTVKFWGSMSVDEVERVALFPVALKISEGPELSSVQTVIFSLEKTDVEKIIAIDKISNFKRTSRLREAIMSWI